MSMSRGAIKNLMLGQIYGQNSDFDKIAPKLDKSKDLYSEEGFEDYMNNLFLKTDKNVLD